MCIVEAHSTCLRSTIIYGFHWPIDEKPALREGVNGSQSLYSCISEKLRTCFIDPRDCSAVGIIFFLSPTLKRFGVVRPVRHVENGGGVECEAAKWFMGTPSHGLGDDQ